MNTTTKNHEDENSSRSQARAQINSICDMIAALECDYDRLEELTSEHAKLLDAVDEATTAHNLATEELEASEECVRYHHDGQLDPNGDTVEHEQYRADFEHHAATKQDLAEARLNLEAWERDNAEELEELSTACNECRDQDDAAQRIQEDALSVEVRSGWQSQGATLEPEEFRIVLCTGGPHCQLIGELEDGTPTRVWMEYSDWGTSLTEYPTTGSDNAALLTYAQQFYFGE